MLTPIQKETFKEFLRQIFPKEQAEYETLMFDLGYAIGAKDDEGIKEAFARLVSKGVPEEPIKQLIDSFLN
jgi:hypothetical protein